MTEKKNEIWIGKNGRGYYIHLTNNHYYNRDTDKIENYTYSHLNEGLDEGDFLDALNKLLYFGVLYSKGIKLKFEKNSVVKIPEKEKQTIEKLIERLEKNAKEIKDLKYTIKMINTFSKDGEFHSKYKKISQA